MGKPTMTRRRFLRDLGVSAGAVPLLAGLDTLYAKAQVPTVPKKRFIVMYTPNGQLYSSWRLPINPSTAGTTGPFITDITTGAGLAALSDPSTIWGKTVTSTSGAVAPPLYKSAVIAKFWRMSCGPISRRANPCLRGRCVHASRKPSARRRFAM